VAGRPRAFGTAVSKIFGAKAIVMIALAAGATGGVALTTTAGAPQEPPAAVSDVPPAGTSAAGGSDARVRPTGSAIDQPPAVAELCRTWPAGDPGAAATDPAFTALVAAAGGAEQVSAFCAGVATSTVPARPDAAPDDAAPGRSEDAPGQAGTAPGRAGTAPGQAGTAPGQAGTAPGQAGTAPGQAGTAPGQDEDGPGRSEDAPGRAGTAPGQATDRPEPRGQAGRDTPQDLSEPEPTTER
jgi:hypothetical protein